MQPKTGLKPTNKITAATVVTVVLFLLSLVVKHVDPQLEQAVNVVVPLIVAYLTPNKPTPGGVPLK